MAIASSSSSLISTFFFHSSSFPRSIITKSKSLHFHSPTNSISHPTLFLLHPPPSPPQTPSTKTPLSLPNLSTPKTCLDSIFIFCTSIALSFTLFISNPDPASAFVVTTPRKLQTDELATVRLFQENTPSVVYITNLAVKQDAFTLDVLEVPQGSGSGFVWDKDGHIVTNYHVISGASDLRVTLADQSTFDAKVVGFDQDKDVAVLRVDAPKDKLRPIPVGVSADLLVGQKVYAIGNPFGLDHALIPARTIPFAWNLISAGYVEQTLHGVLISIVCLLFIGKLLEPVWGPREFLKFIFIVNTLTSLCIFITAIALYYITRQEIYL